MRYIKSIYGSPPNPCSPTSRQPFHSNGRSVTICDSFVQVHGLDHRAELLPDFFIYGPSSSEASLKAVDCLQLCGRQSIECGVLRSKLHRCPIDVVFNILDVKDRPALIDEGSVLRTASVHGCTLLIDGILYEVLDAREDRFRVLQTNCQAVAMSLIGELLDIVDGILFRELRCEAPASTTLVTIRICL